MENEITIHEKLVKIQSELVAPKDQNNTFGNYKYRSCESITKAIKPFLLKYDLVLTLHDDIIEVGGILFVKAQALLQDNSNVNISSTAFAKHPEQQKGMSDSQLTGNASSYARKYALNGLLCIDDSRDADVVERDKKANGLITAGERQKLSILVKNMDYPNNIISEYLSTVHGFGNSADITSDKLQKINETISSGEVQNKIDEVKNATQ